MSELVNVAAARDENSGRPGHRFRWVRPEGKPRGGPVHYADGCELCALLDVVEAAREGEVERLRAALARLDFGDDPVLFEEVR